MIRGRHNRNFAVQIVDLDTVTRLKVEEIMPFLLTVRQEVDGPLTEEQGHEATFRASHHSIQESLNKLQKASER